MLRNSDHYVSVCYHLIPDTLYAIPAFVPRNRGIYAVFLTEQRQSHTHSATFRQILCFQILYAERAVHKTASGHSSQARTCIPTANTPTNKYAGCTMHPLIVTNAFCSMFVCVLGVHRTVRWVGRLRTWGMLALWACSSFCTSPPREGGGGSANSCDTREHCAE